ncbi:MAG: tetraacyldisaccharide 4'-kinase [Pirellulaceae bacterium]
MSKPMFSLRRPAILNPAGYLDLISGRRRGWIATVQRSLLQLGTIPYATVIAGRNWLFDRHLTRSHAVSVPVISVGNITVGGTGKTPLVFWLAQWLAQQDLRVTLISRGYGSNAHEPNDEALELEQRLPGVPHLLNPNRVQAARRAVEELKAQVIVLDDGFQHRRIARDLDLVLVDATNPFGYGHLLPRGTLREPIAALRRADMIALTRVNLVPEDTLEELESQLATYAPQVPRFRVAYQPQKLLNASQQEMALGDLAGRSVAAFCGVGNPQAFRQTLEGCQCEVVDFRAFPDHHPFGPEDIDSLTRWLGHLDGIDSVVCTHKDLVKISLDQLAEIPLWALIVQPEITSGQPALEERLKKLIRQDPEQEEEEPGGEL